MTARSYLTVPQLSEKYPAFKVSSIRWALFNKDQNGLKAAVRKVGRKVLIDEEAFVAWIESKTAA